MLLALLLATASLAPRAEPGVTWTYTVRITGSARDCSYLLADASLSLAQLRETLKRGYDASKGAEILVGTATPARCVRLARRALRQSGFAQIRLRAVS